MTISRRILLLAGAAIPFMAASLRPISAEPAGVVDPIRIDFSKRFVDMEVDELERAYEDMVRNCSPKMIERIQSREVMEDAFSGFRQEIYWLLVQKKSGIIYATNPLGNMHHAI